MHPARYSLITLATLVLLAVLLSSDTLAAKHYLSPDTAGLYAGVSICGKIVYFITSVLAIYLFPLFSARHDRGLDARKTLVIALAAILGGAVVLAAVFGVAPQLVVAPLLGTKFSAAGQFVGLAGIAFGLYGCVYLCAMYLLAQRQSAVIGVLALAASGLLVGMHASHSTIPQLLHVLIVTFGATATVLATWAMARKPANARSVGLEGARAPATVGAGVQQLSALAADARVATGTATVEPDWDGIVETIHNAVGSAPVFLAGSRATGAWDIESDYDIVVVLPLTRIPRAIGRLATVRTALEHQLGAPVSLNPLPRSNYGEAPRTSTSGSCTRRGPCCLRRRISRLSALRRSNSRQRARTRTS